MTVYSFMKASIFMIAMQFISRLSHSGDPDIYLDVPGLIISRGFRWESYAVTTEDGYILTVFRIVNPFVRRDKLKPRPVLLWHGVASSSKSWLINRKGSLDSNGVYSEDNGTVVNDCKQRLTSTLAFTLSACGYDVWLANNRGTTYSNTHVHLNISDPRYWAYSYTELALYDIPATVRRVLQITNKKSLSYIGHSMGTTILFILLSLRPEFEQYFRPFIALAPVAFLGFTRSYMRFIAPIEWLFRDTTVGLGFSIPVIQFISTYICGNKILVYLCLFKDDIVDGNDALNTDPERLPVHTSTMDLASSRVFLHSAQSMNTHRFAQFDYGPIKNLEIYKSVKPPSYPLHQITLKEIYLFQGMNDRFADPFDVWQLIKQISGIKESRVINWPYWNHEDFIWAKFENKFQDVHILKILSSYN